MSDNKLRIKPHIKIRYEGYNKWIVYNPEDERAFLINAVVYKIIELLQVPISKKQLISKVSKLGMIKEEFEFVLKSLEKSNILYIPQNDKSIN